MSNVPALRYTIMSPAMNPRSPMRFTIYAFREACAASGNSIQCPISMYEEKPTNSQHMNRISRLSDNTMPSIGKVKKPSIAKYRLSDASPAMYPAEYKCTRNDTMVTTSTITAAYLSTRIPAAISFPPSVNQAVLKWRVSCSPALLTRTTAPATATRSMNDAVRETSHE